MSTNRCNALMQKTKEVAATAATATKNHMIGLAVSATDARPEVHKPARVQAAVEVGAVFGLYTLLTGDLTPVYLATAGAAYVFRDKIKNAGYSLYNRFKPQPSDEERRAQDLEAARADAAAQGLRFRESRLK